MKNRSIILYLIGVFLGSSGFGHAAVAETVMKVPMSTSSAEARSYFLKGLHELDLSKYPDVTDQLKVKFSDQRSKSDLACVS